MKKGMLVGIGMVVLVVLGVICLTFWKMNVAKGEIVLANRYEAQFNVVETTFDTMRNTIMNEHKCTKEWADKFITVVSEQVKGRPGKVTSEGGGKTAGLAGMLTGGGGGIAVTRESQSLGIPAELYTKLANAIEGKLAETKRAQDVLTDIWQTHKNYCEDPYHNIDILGMAYIDKVKEKPEMISSSVTKEAMETKVFEGELL